MYVQIAALPPRDAASCPPDRSEVEGAPIITYIQPERPGAPVIPFVGLAESLVLAAIRRSGVPMQRVRPALEALSEGLGLDHALASKKLYSDGAELLPTVTPVSSTFPHTGGPKWSSTRVAPSALRSSSEGQDGSKTSCSGSGPASPSTSSPMTMAYHPSNWKT